MKVLDYNLSSSLNGGKITAFHYSRSLSELVGSWSAEAVGGTFKAGNSIDFSGVMKGGIISNAYKDADGLWHIEGKDAGVKLMLSIPDISSLPSGNAKTVIQYLATFCGIDLVMNSNGLSGFNVRSVISGSTCAEAVLELAMLSGYIAFINNDGKLNITAPNTRNEAPVSDNIIDNSGSDIDLDGYATQVLVTLNRHKEVNEVAGDEIFYTGTRPALTPTKVTYSDTFSNGHYRIVMLEPFGVTEKAESSFTRDNITFSTSEDHDYTYKAKTVWRDNQEYVLFAFYERGYTLTTTTEGSYPIDGEQNLTFSETTTETMSRDLSIFDAVGIPEDWEGDIDMVQSETITRTTTRTGGKTPAEDMPAYSPPYDCRITRTFKRQNFGKGLLCNEVESRYEARQVGTISPVKQDGELIPHFLLGSNLAIQTHSSPEWVEVITYRTYYDRYNDEGECMVSTRSEWSDDGSKWLTAHALNATGDNDIDEYQQAYAKFSQQSHGLDISFGSSFISEAWQFLELQGRTKNYYADDAEGIVLANIDDWYDNGEYVKSNICPHYNQTERNCNIYMLPPVSNTTPKSCIYFKGRTGWTHCRRASAVLELARERDTALLDPVIIGSASVEGNNNPKAGYQRDFYVDDIITDAQAQTIANTVAQNILNVKSTKGIRKTVTVPYDPSILPDGLIVEVSHDWANLQTSVSYRDDGDIPEFLISKSVAGVASLVSARENSRQNIPRYGSVVSTNGKNALVRIGNSNISCNTKLKNLGAGDIVLVSFPAGNKLRGQIIARL